MTPRSMSTMRRGWISCLVLAGALYPGNVVLAQGAEISPFGSGVTAPQNTGGNTLSFRVSKTSSGNQELVRFLCGTSGAVSSCTPPAAQYMDSGQAIDVNVTFATGLEGVGSLSLTAFGPYVGTDSGWYNVAVVAPPAGTTYSLAYDGNGKLDRITDPAGRVLEATVTSGLLTTLKDPSLDSVVYGYDSEERLTTRTDRRGHQTTYRYANGLRVTSVEIPLSSPTDFAITSFTNWDEGGLVIGVVGGTQTPRDTALAYTQIDGPRTDVPDLSRFWVDRWGAPLRIVHNPLGAADTTVLTRGDANVPALVTQVRTPNGFVSQATYDSRGNPLTTTDVQPYGPSSQNAVTSYTWDPTWDFVTKIKRPERDSVMLAYNPSNGNRVWQQDGRGDSTRVYFNYGDPYGLLSSIVRPGGARDSIGYTGSLGNPYLIRTPLGAVTIKRQDLMGRDTLVEQYQQRQRLVYDAMNRVIQQSSIGLEVFNVAPAETLLVQNFYDPEGNLQRLVRESRPDVSGVGQITTQWVYDFAGRKVKEIAADGMSDSTVYDPAGNATKVITRRGHSIEMQYDTLSRLTRRTVPEMHYGPRYDGIPKNDWGANVPNTPYPLYPNDGGSGYLVPADVATFSYDIMGRLRSANNGAALIARGYYPNGAITADTQRIRTLSGSDFDQHQYILQYTYDLDGRRVELIHPSQLAADAVRDRTAYTYDPSAGLLSQITDLMGNVFQLSYNARAERINFTSPGGITETYEYDADGRLQTQRLQNGSSSTYRWPESYLRNATYGYDPMGRVAYVYNTAGTADTLFAQYSGLGHLARDSMRTRGEAEVVYPHGGVGPFPINYDAVETDSMDALGNMHWGVTYTRVWNDDLSQRAPTANAYTYLAGIGRLIRLRPDERTDTLNYDEAGNTIWMSTVFTMGSLKQDRASFYSADGTLAAADRRSVSPSAYSSVFEESRYDALGRRVWVRSRVSCTSNPLCRLSKIRRIIWDGSQELYEIQMPGADNDATWLENDVAQVTLPVVISPQDGLPYDLDVYFGRVAYTSGLAIDQPLSLVRFGYRSVMDQQGNARTALDWAPFSIMPRWSDRGLADVGTFDDGGVDRCTTFENVLRCIWVDWPAQVYAYARSTIRRNVWHGSVLQDKRDEAGTYYRRARLYDPATGRFTQEDPVGVAGGLNLYGFADGDPVNFADPFGLRPLTTAERNALGDMCEKIDCDKVQVFEGNEDKKSNDLRAFWLKMSGGTSITVGNNIIVADRHLNSQGRIKTSVLAHELTHVGQNQSWGSVAYGFIGIVTQTWNRLAPGDPAYQVPLPLTQKWEQYGMEQQAVIVELCYAGLKSYCSVSPYSFSP